MIHIHPTIQKIILSIKKVVRYVITSSIDVEDWKLTAVGSNSTLLASPTIILSIMEFISLTWLHTRMDCHILMLMSFAVRLRVSVAMAQDSRKLVDLHIKILMTMAAQQYIKPNWSTATQGHTDVSIAPLTTRPVRSIATVKDVLQLARKHTALCRDSRTSQ